MRVDIELGAGPCVTDGTAQGQLLELTLFRGFEVRSAGVAVPLPLAAQRLLAFVALHPGPLSRGFVAGSLWPDADEGHAHGSLRSALWRLRTIGCRAIEGANDMLSLAEHVDVDLRRGLAMAHAIIDGTTAGPTGIADVQLLAMDLLPGWYDDWALLEAERWRHIRLHALESLAPRLAALGRYCDALMVALEAVRVDPLRESAHAAVIRVHLAEGNVSDARREYDRFAALLDAELGIRPTSRLRGLVNGEEGSVTFP